MRAAGQTIVMIPALEDAHLGGRLLAAYEGYMIICNLLLRSDGRRPKQLWLEYLHPTGRAGQAAHQG
jgi:drug/metabolite transporter superfamily protein YnfA